MVCQRETIMLTCHTVGQARGLVLDFYSARTLHSNVETVTGIDRIFPASVQPTP